jgi:hypothetical protein
MQKSVDFLRLEEPKTKKNWVPNFRKNLKLTKSPNCFFFPKKGKIIIRYPFGIY